MRERKSQEVICAVLNSVVRGIKIFFDSLVQLAR